MSLVEKIRKLKEDIHKGSYINHLIYNDYVRSMGDLNQFLSLNPQINYEESLVLEKAIRSITHGTELINGLRTMNHNLSVESKGFEDTAIEVFSLKNEELKDANKAKKNGRDRTLKKAELWQDYINQFVCEYITTYPFQFDDGQCKNYRKLENFVDTKLIDVLDEGLRNTSGKNKGRLTPPRPNKTKLNQGIAHCFSGSSKKG